MDWNFRVLMMSPKGPDEVGYAEVKRPEQSSPHVRSRYSICSLSGPCSTWVVDQLAIEVVFWKYKRNERCAD
jgi:hypothetical protein